MEILVEEGTANFGQIPPHCQPNAKAQPGEMETCHISTGPFTVFPFSVPSRVENDPAKWPKQHTRKKGLHLGQWRGNEFRRRKNVPAGGVPVKVGQYFWTSTFCWLSQRSKCCCCSSKGKQANKRDVGFPDKIAKNFTPKIIDNKHLKKIKTFGRDLFRLQSTIKVYSFVGKDQW